MKRLITVLVLAIMCLSLAACQNQGNDENISSEEVISESVSSVYNLSDIFKEISSQSFFNESVSHMEILGDVIYAAVPEGDDSLKNFLNDKQYKDVVTIENNSDTPYIKWLNKLMAERGINDLSIYSGTIRNLEYDLNNELDKASYGGIGRINSEFYDEDMGGKIVETVGLEIFCVDIDKVKPVVEEHLKNISSSVGKIDIKYAECDYSINDLESISAEIASQSFYDEATFELTIYGGTVVAVVDEEEIGRAHV